MPNFQIEFQVNQSHKSETEWETILTKVATATLKHQQVNEDAVLTLLITGDAELQQLNRDYRGEDKPTDVLSFEDGSMWPDGNRYLGDIAISQEMAERQAVQAGHPLVDEMALLAAHGVLHLLGHDHAEPEEKTLMWAAQKEILAELEISVSLDHL